MNIRKKNKRNAVPSLFAAMWIDSLIQFRSFFVCTSAENLIVCVRVSIIFRRLFPRFSSIFRGTILDSCAPIMSHKIISNAPHWISTNAPRARVNVPRRTSFVHLFECDGVMARGNMCISRVYMAANAATHSYVYLVCAHCARREFHWNLRHWRHFNNVYYFGRIEKYSCKWR